MPELDFLFPDISGILREENRDAPADFRCSNERAAFQQAFSSGIFHEEEPYWSDVADSLTNGQIANLALSAIRPMVSGNIAQRDEPDWKLLMEFYQAMYKWFNGHLRSPTEILDPLQRFRSALISATVANKTPWWVEVLRGFSLVEFAITKRMGMHPIDISSIYDRAISECLPDSR
jgi:hypothetical protein